MMKWLSKELKIMLEDKIAYFFATVFAVTQLSILIGLTYAFVKFYRIDQTDVVYTRPEALYFPFAFLAVVVIPFITCFLLKKYIFEPLYKWVK